MPVHVRAMSPSEGVLEKLTRDSFIRGGNARAPLQIKKKMLLRLLSYHQVMSSFLDFVLAFGAHALPPEIRFSGFREQNLLSHPGKLKWDALGRSGKQYQIAFNLKTAGLYPDPSYPHQEFWTIRQAAFHHQFDADNGTSLWIVVKGDWEIRDRVQQMTGPQGRKEDRSFGTPAECFVASLSVHLLLCDWSAEQWRWYLKSLEDSFGNEVRRLLASYWKVCNADDLYRRIWSWRRLGTAKKQRKSTASTTSKGRRDSRMIPTKSSWC